MPCEDEPGGGAPVHLSKMVLDPVVLLCAPDKIMLCAHHHKMHLPIVKPKPGLVNPSARHGEA